MKRKRLVGFILAIALGMTAALLYGWFIHPAAPASTTLASLRSDYQADYVLMVAESYPQSEDIPYAIEMLRYLNQSDPLRAVDQALLTAQQLGYSDANLHLMASLEIRMRQYGGGQ